MPSTSTPNSTAKQLFPLGSRVSNRSDNLVHSTNNSNKTNLRSIGNYLPFFLLVYSALTKAQLRKLLMLKGKQEKSRSHLLILLKRVRCSHWRSEKKMAKRFWLQGFKENYMRLETSVHISECLLMEECCLMTRFCALRMPQDSRLWQVSQSMLQVLMEFQPLVL